MAAGFSFTVSLNLRTQPPGGWAGYDAEITYSDVTYVAGSIHQQGAGVWPGCAFGTGEIGFLPGDARFACADSNAGNQKYTGVLATLAFECDSLTQARITLVHGDLNTDLVDMDLQSYYDDSDQLLTINCVAPTTTPTPTATPTPRPTVVGGISLDPRAGGSSGSNSGMLAGIIAGATAAAIALGGAAWHVKRRRVQ